jgi:hypothetical protein
MTQDPTGGQCALCANGFTTLSYASEHCTRLLFTPTPDYSSEDPVKLSVKQRLKGLSSTAAAFLVVAFAVVAGVYVSVRHHFYTCIHFCLLYSVGFGLGVLLGITKCRRKMQQRKPK